jgi:N-acylneuraminate cytidylyltransferase
MDKYNIVGLIPVKGNSSRIPNKNIRPFADTTLLDIKIKQLLSLQELGFIDKVFVNSDSNEILSIAESYIDVVRIKRPDGLDATCFNLSIMQGILQDINSESIVLCQVTSPFIMIQTLKKCINTYLLLASDKYFPIIQTVNQIKKFVLLGTVDGLQPINYNVNKFVATQNINDTYVLNGGCFVFNRKLAMVEWPIKQKRFIETSEYEGVDIDSILDFAIAEFLWVKDYK